LLVVHSLLTEGDTFVYLRLGVIWIPVTVLATIIGTGHPGMLGKHPPEQPASVLGCARSPAFTKPLLGGYSA
jgi:hypothetical protein